MIRNLGRVFSTRGCLRESATGGRRSRALHPLVNGLERRELLSAVVVSGQANIYGAGLKVPPDPGGGGGGVLPVQVDLSALGSPKTLDFPTVTGQVSGWAAAGGYNGPDGGPYWGGVTNVPAYGGISGIRDANATMFLVGVFLGPTGQPRTAPPTQNVTPANSAATFSPLIGQQFFIGDGRSLSQALQTFNVPAGATRLFLGFAEVWGFGNPARLPGYYSDNGGSLSVDVEPSTALPDVVMDEATTTDSQTVTATYDVEAADVTQPLTFNIYRSASATGYTASNLIGTDTLGKADTADLSAGHHQVALKVNAQSLLPDTSRPYVVVVANPGKAVAETYYTNDSAYFRIFVLGAISHGYESLVDDPLGLTPSWELTMASTLQSVDHYDDVIAFNWAFDSRKPQSGLAAADARGLADQIVAKAASLTAGHRGDVVQLHLIGHSRGTVIVSQAAMRLQTLFLTTPADRTFLGSYIRMTLLDPHPASNYKTKAFFSASADSTGRKLVDALVAFQSLADDPNVYVPSIVNYAEVYYQQTPVSALTDKSAAGGEASLNLWGQGPTDGVIGNGSASPIKWYSLTSRSSPGIGVIGHSEVPLYYQNAVVALNKTLAL